MVSLLITTHQKTIPLKVMLNKITMIKKHLYIALVFVFSTVLGQNTENILTFDEYMGYVKKYHPMVKQANVTLNMSEAKLLEARGAFDPKIEVDYDRKKFKGTEYYDELNTTFKIPTWYGIEFKANFEENSGVFLDPSLTTPQDGLYSAGISFSLAQDLFIDERMAALKQAKLFIKQTEAERLLLVNEILFKAREAYYRWSQANNEVIIYTAYLVNAETRYNGIKRSAEEGDKAAIDVVEAEITLQNRKLKLKESELKEQKAALLVSNYLWLNGVPLELENTTSPEPIGNLTNITATPITNQELESLLTNHPKLESLEYKRSSLTIEERLNKNNLLPKVNFQYNFLTSDIETVGSFNTSNYKAFINVSFPLFLRKERGKLKLTKFKIDQLDFDQANTQLSLKNKILAITNTLTSLEDQQNLIKNIVTNYKTLVNAEERKFNLGESSLFLVNSREKNLIEAQLKETELQTKKLITAATLQNTLGKDEGVIIE